MASALVELARATAQRPIVIFDYLQITQGTQRGDRHGHQCGARRCLAFALCRWARSSAKERPNLTRSGSRWPATTSRAGWHTRLAGCLAAQARHGERDSQRRIFRADVGLDLVSFGVGERERRSCTICRP